MRPTTRSAPAPRLVVTLGLFASAAVYAPRLAAQELPAQAVPSGPGIVEGGYVYGPRVTAPAAPVAPEMTEAQRAELAYATRTRGARFVATAFAHLGGSIAFAAPGAALVVYAAQPCARCEFGPPIGASFGALGALTGMLLGGSWAAWSAHNRLGGRASFARTVGGTALGYVAPWLVISVYSLTGVVGGTAAAPATFGVPHAIVLGLAAFVSPAIFAALLDDEATERALRPRAATAPASPSARASRRTNLAMFAPTIAPLAGPTGSLAGVSFGLSGANF